MERSEVWAVLVSYIARELRSTCREQTHILTFSCLIGACGDGSDDGGEGVGNGGATLMICNKIPYLT